MFQTTKTFVLPYIKAEGERLQYALEGPLVNNVDKIAAEHVKSQILVRKLKDFTVFTIFLSLICFVFCTNVHFFTIYVLCF